MNREIWTEQTGRRWAAAVAEMRKQRRFSRMARRATGCFAVVYPLLGILEIYAEPDNWSQPLTDLILCWCTYRFYQWFRRNEFHWHSLIHHGQRMLVETVEQAEWHSQQIDALFGEMKKQKHL